MPRPFGKARPSTHVVPKIAISRTPESVEVSRDEALAKTHDNSLAYRDLQAKREDRVF
jgi:hypothetical protein